MNKLKELEIPGSVKDSNCYCELEGMTTAIKFGEGVSEVYLSSSCALTSYQSMVRRVELPSTVTKFSDYRREELARVRVVTLQTENTPQNLLLAMIPETRYKPNGYSYSSCEALKNEIYCIQTPERTILVPSNISEKSIQEINDTMNRIGAYIPANLFRYCKDIKQKLPMAFLEWQNSHDEATKRYLKRNRKKLVQDLVEEGMDEALARFLKTGIYEKKEMQDVYDIIAEADSMKMSKAYLKGKDTGEEIDMRAVERLAEICKECDCRIVLSSSWRELCGSETKEPHSMYRYLKDCLGKYGMEIVDVTPVIMSNRPEEIAAWLKENGSMVKNFVSLDDDFDEKHYKSFGLGGHLVKTKFYVDDETKGGLLEEHVKKAKRILKGD